MIDAVAAPAIADPAADTEKTMVVPRPPPDPHASKMPPDHPGLRLRKPPFRVLRRGPILVVAMTIGTLFAIALGRGFVNADSSNASDPNQPAGPEAPRAVANLEVVDIVKNAPGNNSPVNAPKPPAPAGASVLATREAQRDPRSVVLDQAVNTTASPQGASPPERPTKVLTPEQEARRQALERARAGSLFFAGGEADSAERPSAPPTQGTSNVVGNGNGAGPHPVVAGAAEQDPNGQAAKSAFMEDTAKDHANYNTSQLTQPASPFEVKAGSIIPTTLITGIDSDLPGEVVAQVRENVYDTVTGAYLLIPQGSRLLARYDSAVTYGQERVLMCWKRLIRPDGSSIDLECAPGVDLSGQSGFADQVDNHWARLIVGVVLTSLLGAVTQSATGSVEGYRPTLAQNFTAGAATEFASAGQQITRRNLSVQPTVKIRPGFSVNVLVNKDLVIPPYRLRLP